MGADRNTDARRAGSWLRLLVLCFCAGTASQTLAQEATEEVEGLPAIATTNDIIKTIEFVGNRVTRPQILQQEMLVKVGDIADPLLIERSRQAIMDLGLFVSVRAYLESADDGSVLRIVVKEKYYILPVPRLNRDEENNISFGAELSLDNLAGLNQQLKLRYETERADGVSGGDLTTSSVLYNYPRVFGSSYNAHFELSEQHSPAEVVSGTTLTSLYDRAAWVASAQLTRWLDLRGPSRGWLVGGGPVWRRNAYEYVSGVQTGAFPDVQAVGLSVLGQFIDVHDYLYSRSGVDFAYQGEYGLQSLGSDTHYTRHQFYYRRYFLLEGRPHENIEIQSKFGLSAGSIFPGDVYAYCLGGSKSMRGFGRGDLCGDAYVLLNLQYLRPLFGYYPVRGAVFMDVGNVYPSNTELHLGDLRWDVGVGLRVRLKSFVKIDLRVDVAYAYETGEIKVFAVTGDAF